MKQIDFIPVSEEANTVPPPQPISKNLPDWYKHIPAFRGGKNPTFDSNGNVDSTLKMCVPFADSLRLGYVQKTWTEISISGDVDGLIQYNYSTSPQILAHRDVSHLSNDFFRGHFPLEFIWKMQYAPKLPKGYSVLITHPLNRQDLPFTTLTGVIDADDYFHLSEGNIPFMVKKDFDGIVPVGTPMYQIIPFKRDDWKSKGQLFDFAKRQNGKNIDRHFWHGYKKLIWKKKTFK